MPSQVYRVLCDYRSWLYKHMSQHEASILNGQRYVVCKEDGSPYNPSHISRLFKRFLETNNLPAIRFHDLRHTYATHAHNKGMPIKALSKSLGHQSAATSIDNYVHIPDDFFEDEEMEGLSYVLQS